MLTVCNLVLGTACLCCSFIQLTSLSKLRGDLVSFMRWLARRVVLVAYVKAKRLISWYTFSLGTNLAIFMQGVSEFRILLPLPPHQSPTPREEFFNAENAGLKYRSDKAEVRLCL